MLAALAALCMPLELPALAQESTPAEKPNILVIMADDIGYWNISACTPEARQFLRRSSDGKADEPKGWQLVGCKGRSS
jgi:hypothetical protein